MEISGNPLRTQRTGTFCANTSASSAVSIVMLLALQRQFESFPFFEFFEAAFTMGLISLVIALLMIAQEFQNVFRFPFRMGQSPFD